MAKSAEIEELRPYQVALRQLKGRTELDRAGGSSFEIAASVADRIMSADNIDDVLAIPEDGPGNIDDFIGKPFRLVGQSLTYSQSSEQYREGGTGFYALFKVMDMNGAEHLVSTGSVNVVFQLKRLEELGVFDNEGPTEKYFTVRTRPVPSGTLYWLAAA